MKTIVTIMLIFSLHIWAQEQLELELDEKFVNNSTPIDYEKSPKITSWGKAETFSSFLHLKERISNNHNPVFVFVIDGGDLFEAENIAKFMNSPEGRSFRTIVNYMLVDSRTLHESKVLKKKILADGNMFLMDNKLKVLAHSKVNYYKTKTGPDWWAKIKTFIQQNKEVVDKVTNEMRLNSDRQLIKRFDEALDKIKNSSFRERRKAIKSMKSMTQEIGFLLLPVTNEKDPEASRTAEKLLMENQTRLNFPVNKTVPAWFDFNKQVAFLTK
jgi:hypothetical protein